MNEEYRSLAAVTAGINVLLIISALNELRQGQFPSSTWISLSGAALLAGAVLLVRSLQ